MKRFDGITFMLLLAAALAAFWGGAPGPVVPVAPPPVKVTSVTYVYEKDSTAIPPPVLSGLNKLNREGVLATTFEQDTVDGTGETPSQYKAPLSAAKAAGLPSLVATAGEVIVRTVKDPKTEAAVIEAAK